jgi:hypothetical protein
MRRRNKATPESEVLSQCGEYADDPQDGVFFHGFPSSHVMTKRLKMGVWGSKGMSTSVGVSTSQIPYMNVVYFMPDDVDLHPVFYPYPDCPVDEGALKELIAADLGIDDWVEAKVIQWFYRKENEWYAIGQISLKAIVIIGVVYMARHGPPARLVEWCRKRDIPLSRWGE